VRESNAYFDLDCSASPSESSAFLTRKQSVDPKKNTKRKKHETKNNNEKRLRCDHVPFHQCLHENHLALLATRLILRIQQYFRALIESEIA
jgi:hypothetical protein